VTPLGFALQENVPLAPKTTLGVGGPARYYSRVSSEAQARAAIAWAGERHIPALALGGGSNLVVADRGFGGLVLDVGLRGVNFDQGPEAAVVDAAAGEAWDALVAAAVDRGLLGLEALSGIPGEVGATPIQNVGAYGQEVGDTIVGVRAIDLATAQPVELDRASLHFGYRDSIFKQQAKSRFLITAVRFRLRPDGVSAIAYAEVQAKLEETCAGRRGSWTGCDVRGAVLGLRRAKAMLYDPSDPNGRSVGSFFMNPTVESVIAADLERRMRASGVLGPSERMPAFAGARGVKLSAAWLIERSGLAKGTSLGPVGLSTKHALAIINRGGATATDVVRFARQVRQRVADAFGVALRAEPAFVGFEAGELEGLSETAC
jgi:UDP-N-acetylmuramate dehydrogenase